MFVERTSVGLDVHARSIAAAAIDTATGEFFKDTLVPQAEVVLDWIRALPGPVAVTYEAGPTGFGLARALRDAGLPAGVDAVACDAVGVIVTAGNVGLTVPEPGMAVGTESTDADGTVDDFQIEVQPDGTITYPQVPDGVDPAVAGNPDAADDGNADPTLPPDSNSAASDSADVLIAGGSYNAGDPDPCSDGTYNMNDLRAGSLLYLVRRRRGLARCADTGPGSLGVQGRDRQHRQQRQQLRPDRSGRGAGELRRHDHLRDRHGL